MKRGDTVRTLDGKEHAIHCIRPDGWLVLQTQSEVGLSLQIPLACVKPYATGYYLEVEDK